MKYEIKVHNAEWMIAVTNEWNELVQWVGPFMSYREANRKLNDILGR